MHVNDTDDANDVIAETFGITAVRARPVLAPQVPAVTALAAARRLPHLRKKLKWRTRDSQASRLYNLELDVMNLRQEIQRLVEYRQVLQARTLNRRDALDGFYVKTVMEYHRVFRNGYHPGAVLDAIQYVTSVMEEDMSIGRFVGRDVVLNQWERYTKALSGLEVGYLRSRVVSSPERTLVASYATYKHIVTQDTLEMMFPHALREYPQIVAKTIGRTFHGEGRFDFTFDTKTHRVVSFDFQMDFLDVFARLLQDPTDLCALFQGARISEDFLIGDVGCYEECLQELDIDTNPDLDEEKLPMFAQPPHVGEKRTWSSSQEANEEYRQPSPAGLHKLELEYILG